MPFVVRNLTRNDARDDGFRKSFIVHQFHQIRQTVFMFTEINNFISSAFYIRLASSTMKHIFNIFLIKWKLQQNNNIFRTYLLNTIYLVIYLVISYIWVLYMMYSTQLRQHSYIILIFYPVNLYFIGLKYIKPVYLYFIYLKCIKSKYFQENNQS